MFINVKKIKQQNNKIKLIFTKINPLLLTFILTLVTIWCFFKVSLIFSVILLLISFLFLFVHYQKYHWLTLFLLIPILSLLIQNYFLRDKTYLNQEIENEIFKIINKTSNYVILQWKQQKFYWATFNNKFIVGQILKIHGIVSDTASNTNSFNFNFAKYLENKNVYKALKNVTFEVLESKNLKFLFFNWIERQKFPHLIRFLIFQQPNIQPIKKALNELSLSYLLNFSGLNLFVLIFCLNKIWKKFSFSDYWKIPFHCLLLFFLYLINFPLISSRIVIGLIIKNILSIFKIQTNYLNKNLLTLNCLFLINAKFIFEQIFFYLIIAYIFFQKPTNFKDINFWWINLLKTTFIFTPLVIFFQYRWNLTAPFLSLIISPLIAGLYFLAFLLWWIPQLNNFWFFLEGSLFEILQLFKYISFSWNFGNEPLILFLIYYLFLFILFNKKKFSKFAFICFILVNFFIVLYSKIILPQEIFFMLNVGNGSSFVYINKWKNLVIIYDCGNGPGSSSTNMADFLKTKGINHVNFLFISHFHQDHYNGLDAIKNTTSIYKIITNETTKLTWQIKGIEIRGWKLENMKDLNDSSLVLLIKTQIRNILLMGDLTKIGEEKLMKDTSFARVIKEITINLMQLGHHGSKTSSSEKFLTFINPQKIFISAGIKNKHQFPDIEVINLLKKLGLKFFSTQEKINWKYNLINNQVYCFK